MADAPEWTPADNHTAEMRRALSHRRGNLLQEKDSLSKAEARIQAIDAELSLIDADLAHYAPLVEKNTG